MKKMLTAPSPTPIKELQQPRHQLHLNVHFTAQYNFSYSIYSAVNICHTRTWKTPQCHL